MRSVKEDICGFILARLNGRRAIKVSGPQDQQITLWRIALMAKSKPHSRKSEEDEKLTLNQGFVRDSDLEPGAEEVKVMTPREVDASAKTAEATSKKKSKDLQGEGNYKAAQSYDRAARDFTKKHQR